MLDIKEAVRSAQNKYVSLARSLGDRKQRQKQKLFRFDGVKLFCESLQKGVRLSFVLVSEGKIADVINKAKSIFSDVEDSVSCPIIPVEDTLFERISEEQAPEGIICVGEYMAELHCECDGIGNIGEGENILLLESVRDPLNVGAIVRAARALGVDRIIMSRDCADIYSPKTLRASMGCLFSMKLQRVESIPNTVRALRADGRRVFGAALKTDAWRLGEIQVQKRDCVLIGNEGHGLSNEAMDACTGCVYIPMAEGVESLNAATAASVLVWEFFGRYR